MKRRAVTIVAAGTVALAIVVALVVARGDGARHTPARLPIVAGRRSAQSGTAANVDAGPLAPYGLIVYKAGPALPALDGSARAYRVESNDIAAAARRLADALGLHGDASDNGDGGLVLSDGSAQLVVSKRDWSYSRDQSGAVSSGVAVACPPDASSCASDTAPPAPTRPANLPSEGDARAMALAFLDKVGVDTKDAAVTTDDGVTQWFVTVAPMVDGTATEGFGSSVILGDKGVIEAASGILGRATAADEYPLIGTATGIDRLNHGYSVGAPVPRAGVPAPTETDAAGSGSAASGAPGSVAPGEPVEPPAVPIPEPSTSTEPPVSDTIPPPAPQEVALTGAERVLLYLSSADGQEGWLVPAYRFATADGPGPTVIAVDDQFLTPPDAIEPAVKSAGAPTGATDRGR